MRFGSVCSGIEAASVAWNPIGWEAAWFAEIEPFPCAVLKHHYPEVPNYGDMTKFKEWNAEPIDLLCGGTPCQSFSVAGLRKGLDDPRGNLMLTFGAIADHFRPKWLVWENVPGVLSSNGGRDFGSFLWMLGQLGYGFAYRVLDAHYFGVPQRRRRVFVVGCLGDWRSAAAVLFERHSLLGHPAPSREARQKVTGTIEASLGRSRGAGTQVAMCLTTKVRIDAESETLIPTLGGHFSYGIPGNWIGRKPENGGNAVEPMIDVSPCLTGTDRHGVATTQYGEIAGSLTARHDSSPCSDRWMNVIAQTVPTLTSNGDAHTGFRDENGLVPVAYPINTQIITRHKALGEGTGFGMGEDGDPAYTIQAAHSHGIATNTAVRRLTPTECERLQGFPDGWTSIPWRGKPESPDGPRYKALGNSWAVPVVRWIGERIQQVDTLR